MTNPLAHLDIKVAEVPTRTYGRTAQPNPFEDIVKTLKVDDPKDARTFTLAGVSVETVATGKDGKARKFKDENLRQIDNQLGYAGDALGVTVRKRIRQTPDGAEVTFWVITRITRDRKPKDETASK